jgi:hypothetical protein
VLQAKHLIKHPKPSTLWLSKISYLSHIAGLEDKAIEVPDYFNAVLDRVIQVRRLFSQKLEAAGKAIDVASDSRHAFFVSVLEQVRDSIKPLLSADAFDFASLHKAVPKSDANDTLNSPLRNLFEVLDVYEPSADFLAAPNVTPPPQPSELEVTVEVPDDDIIEAYFATTSLMDDLSRLRAEVKELWSRHHAGELDLATVSVATNTAIDLAHGLEAEIQPVLKHLTETQPWHQIYFTAMGHSYGIDISSQNVLTQADYNFKAYHIADALFYNARLAIVVFLANMSPGVPMNYNGKWGRFDENALSPPSSNKAKYLRDNQHRRNCCRTYRFITTVLQSLRNSSFMDLPQLRSRPRYKVSNSHLSGFVSRHNYTSTFSIPLKYVCMCPTHLKTTDQF